jgi:hypothetical protein
MAELRREGDASRMITDERRIASSFEGAGGRLTEHTTIRRQPTVKAPKIEASAIAA